MPEPLMPDTLVRGDREIGAALATGWAKTCAEAEEIDVNKVTEYSIEWGVKYDFSRCRPATSTSHQHFLERVHHSSAVPDGTPYAAWQNTSGQGAVTLFGLGEEISCGLLPGLAYNSAMTIFVPKGVDNFDDEEITREAESTRPLACKNCDNKAVASVTNNTMRPAVMVDMVDVQRGFIPGRQLGQNIVDLDSAARAFGMQGETSFSDPLGKSLCPLLAFYDFAAAFPYLIQRSMFLV